MKSPFDEKVNAAISAICTKIAAQAMAGMFPQETTKMKVHRVEIRQTRTRKGWQWSWRALARNGRKLGWSGELLQRRAACEAEVVAVMNPFLRGIPVFEYSRDGKSRKQLYPNITAVSADIH